jgi:hypothetical protein
MNQLTRRYGTVVNAEGLDIILEHVKSMKKALLSRMRVLFILGHYLIAMKMKLSEVYLQCQDKSGRLGGVAGSVVLYVTLKEYFLSTYVVLLPLLLYCSYILMSYYVV